MDATKLAQQTLGYATIQEGLTHYAKEFARVYVQPEEKFRTEFERFGQRVIDIIVKTPPVPPNTAYRLWDLEYHSSVRTLLREGGVAEHFTAFRVALGIPASPTVGVPLIRISTTIGMVAGLILHELDPSSAQFWFWA